jgi:hypothetical protein
MPPSSTSRQRIHDSLAKPRISAFAMADSAARSDEFLPPN